uniref:Uncharacterized protein n=1 Tax=Tanacetum cinerariifolium TaxID=118510 RepID=A0A6L2J208_TANCI|nr:hypothetical protein [Tanacetum cinerariifolium]
MVAYLKKPTWSEGFQEIVDFLNGTHIRTFDNEEQEITTTVDGKEFTVTEASVRRRLQLAYAEGISVLPTTEIFDQLSLMGYVSTDDKLTFQKDAAQASGNILKTQSTTMPNVPFPQETGAGGSPRCQEVIGGSIAQTSTNKSVNVVPSVSVASPKAKVSTLPNVDSLNDAMIYSFFSSQSNSPQLNNKDLKQIDLDDLEETDLKWQMVMLTMRARRFLEKTKRNLGAKGTDTIGFDMSKVKCYNCHRRGYFTNEYRSPRDNKNKETTRRTIPVKVSTSNALVSQCDVVGGYDWSFQAKEEPTNYALMAFTSSGSSSFSGSDNVVAHCSKAYSKSYATLQTHYENLTVEYRKSQLNVISYKTGLESIEARLVVYQQNETVFEEDIKLLKLDVIQESNNQVIKNQENDRYKTCEGYHVVPSPYTGNFLPPKPDLVFTDDTNASESEANVVNVELSEHKTNKDKSKTHRPDAPIIEDWISDSEDESETKFVPK